MSRLIKLSVLSVTEEQKAYLDGIKERTSVPINTTIKTLIQKAMDEAEVQACTTTNSI